MKRNFLLSTLSIIGIMLGFSSCVKDCYTCTAGTYSDVVCQADYGMSKSAFKTYIKLLRAQGYTCK